MNERELQDHERGMKSQAEGRWGEDLAAHQLESEGWKIVGRNVRPFFFDRRCEIDLIARQGDGIVFVEVKTRRTRTEWSPALLGIDRRKKKVLLKACGAWLRKAKWDGNFRFDVVEITGEKDSPTPPTVEHYENVPLFPYRFRFR